MVNNAGELFVWWSQHDHAICIRWKISQHICKVVQHNLTALWMTFRRYGIILYLVTFVLFFLFHSLSRSAEVQRLQLEWIFYTQIQYFLICVEQFLKHCHCHSCSIVINHISRLVVGPWTSTRWYQWHCICFRLVVIHSVQSKPPTRLLGTLNVDYTLQIFGTKGIWPKRYHCLVWINKDWWLHPVKQKLLNNWAFANWVSMFIHRSMGYTE